MRPNNNKIDVDKLLPWLKIKGIAIPVEIATVSQKDLPEKPGVYIMLSSRTEYAYPWSCDRGKSRVYYIGQTLNLSSRLSTHKKYCLEARNSPDPRYRYYWPRYEYAAYHGCNVCWKTCKSEQDAKDLEHRLLVDFADYYGAKPVANGQSAWE